VLYSSTLPALALPLLQERYASGSLSPSRLAMQIAAACDAAKDDTAWITRIPAEDLLKAARDLEARDPAALPLYGVPFAVKDNIDVAGLPTTAACPEFASVAASTAAAVVRLLDAGALLIGKTNLDQFATGLVGTRSPYGAVPNSFRPEFIGGGSSSGSASVVARGLACFALGTDTAGSGRVPAGLNNVVGLKPTRGLVSTRGVLPACRSLDCVSIFALTVDDARDVLATVAGFDATDPFSRRRAACREPIVRVGIPATPEFFGDAEQAAQFAAAIERAHALGCAVAPIDFTPLHEAAALLYDGPWVAERHAAIRSFFDTRPDALDPTVRAVIASARAYSATDAFAAAYRLTELKRSSDELFERVDALLVPTVPTLYTIDAVRADPLRLNSRLGVYTNFVNLLDLAALAVPSSMRADGLPFGVTLIGPAWSEPALINLGARWQSHAALPLGATAHPLPPPTERRAPAAEHGIRIAVVGAHLTDMPLNGQLAERGAARVRETTTTPAYRLFALSNTAPPKPGLQRVARDGVPIAVEVWDMPLENFGSFVAEVRPPLAIGSVELADGSWVKGFVCEPFAFDGARDISSFGGWRNFLRGCARPSQP